MAEAMKITLLVESCQDYLKMPAIILTFLGLQLITTTVLNKTCGGLLGKIHEKK